jgi:hypothetical protein
MENNNRTGTIIEINRTDFYGVLREDFTHTEFMFSIGDNCTLKPYDQIVFKRDEMFEHPVAKSVKHAQRRGA